MILGKHDRHRIFIPGGRGGHHLRMTLMNIMKEAILLCHRKPSDKMLTPPLLGKGHANRHRGC